MGRNHGRGEPHARQGISPLTAFLDTNVLIRHLTGEPPDQAERASEMLNRNDWLILTDVIAAECAFVLESVYGMSKPATSGLLRQLIDLPSVVVPNHDLLSLTLSHYGESGLSFADAYLIACAQSGGVNAVASFDKAFDRIPGIERIAS